MLQDQDLTVYGQAKLYGTRSPALSQGDQVVSMGARPLCCSVSVLTGAAILAAPTPGRSVTTRRVCVSHEVGRPPSPQ